MSGGHSTPAAPADARRPKQPILRGPASTSTARADAEAPVLWLPDAKSQLIRKDPDAGKD